MTDSARRFTTDSARRFTAGAALAAMVGLVPGLAQAQALSHAIVFVSRAIPPNGTIYWNVPNDMPGVGPRSRFRVAAPGRLQVREPSGVIRTIIDGANPTAASMQLIDVNAPDVSYDGQRIVFAGLRAGSYSTAPGNNPNAWRLYIVNVDGSGLRQLTFSEDRSALVGSALAAHDDTDPAWLPDGRIVFSSTRWPAYAQYGGVRATNLYVIGSNGSGLHRITAERNGADRPLVDPVTGKIVFARWWRNHRFGYDGMQTVAASGGGYVFKDGLSADRAKQLDGSSRFVDELWRNAWQAAAINPDGTGLAMWAGSMRFEEANHTYGGAFSAAGEFFANFFPMLNMAEAAGFGGVRRYVRGPGLYSPVIGVTKISFDYVSPSNPTSFGVLNGIYVSEPDVLPDGRLVVSMAPNVAQDYGLYVVNANGTGLTPLYDVGGTSELRARVIRPRPLPPVVADTVTQVPALMPPPAGGPYDGDGTFVFDALNVYFNAPVDTDIVSAPAVGSAATIRFFIDHQRSSTGSFPALDWPILLGTRTVKPDGSVREPAAPANVPLFEQLRSPDNRVPTTGGPNIDGAGHVAGMNYGRPGTTARCVGCHAGHTLIPVPADPEDARWTNLAPGATVTVSSSRDPRYDGNVVDRRVQRSEIYTNWTSAPGAQQNQWIRLVFPVPITIRQVRLYNTRYGDEANSSIQVNQATVRIYSDAAATQQVAAQTVGALSVAGTDAFFSNVVAQAVRVDLNSVSGTFYGIQLASLGEIEVIGSGDTNVDLDGDGMPDGWELQFGLSPSNGGDGGGDLDGDGVSNLNEYRAGTHPNGRHARYFAEGATSDFFRSTFALLNPGATRARVLMRFLRSSGSPVSRYLSVAPRTRATLRASDVLGLANAEFATVIESDQPVVADRTMTWDASGYGSHAETGVPALSTTWFLAEGATHSGFNLFYLIQNPGSATASVEVTYLLPAPNPPLVRTYSVRPNSRSTIWVNEQDPRLRSTDVSAKIRSTNGVKVLVERAMYLNVGGRLFGAGHESAAVPAASPQWFLAEGATGPYFDLFVLVANPSASAANIRAEFLLPSGATVTKTYSVAANSRFTIWVDLVHSALANTAVSTTITSTNGVPVIAERAMWWPGQAAAWQEAHNSAGATSTGRTWALAEGEVGGPANVETYVLIANTSTFGGQVRVTLLFEDGSQAQKTYNVGPKRRFNVAVQAEFAQARGRKFGVLVESIGSSPPQIVVERAMYSDADGRRWAAGTNALATRLQ